MGFEVARFLSFDLHTWSAVSHFRDLGNDNKDISQDLYGELAP